jgi:hypothetical protein
MLADFFTGLHNRICRLRNIGPHSIIEKTMSSPAFFVSYIKQANGCTRAVSGIIFRVNGGCIFKADNRNFYDYFS